MKHKIINTGYYLYIIDPEETSEVDKITFVKEGDTKPKVWYYNNNKILAHLPLNNSPILKGVDLLPPLEDDSNKLAYEYAVNYRCPATNDKEYCKHDIVSAYNNGYNKSKEKYKYTEEDIMKAYDFGSNALLGVSKNNLIQSLRQPKMPVGFKCEMKQKSVNGSIPVNQEWEYEPKTTTNSQGLTQWVGEWIY